MAIKMRRLTTASLALLVFALLIPVSPARSATTQTVTFINVGQGDSALIQDGAGFDVLIDGGITSQGAAVDSFIKEHGAADLEIMLASHADTDHIGGLIAVLNDPEVTVHAVLYNGYPGTSAAWGKFVAAAEARGLNLTPVQFPAVQTWGGMTAYILNPSGGLDDPETNDASVVLRLDYGNMRTLFTGDIDRSIEATVVARQTPVAADVLKVAHHGSANSTSAAFLTAVHPAFAVISVGENSYGHPSPETLARLADVGAEVYRTDESWNVTASSDGATVSISTAVRLSIYLPIIQKF
jgi:competence protein ComEC